MDLHGSCHCGKVSFDVVSHTPVPYMRCYCSICRKCQGGGGYMIDVLAEKETMRINGEKYIKVYQAILDKKVPVEEQKLSKYVRYFCGECGSHLWGYDDRRPKNVYPMASAIDTDLPLSNPEDIYHIMLNKESKCNWVRTPEIDEKRSFSENQNDTMLDWHKAHNQYIE